MKYWCLWCLQWFLLLIKSSQCTQIELTLSVMLVPMLTLVSKHAEGWNLTHLDQDMSHRLIIQTWLKVQKFCPSFTKVCHGLLTDSGNTSEIRSLWAKGCQCQVILFSSSHVTACMHWNLHGHCVTLAGMQVDSGQVKTPSPVTLLKALNINVWWHNKVGCPVCAMSTCLTETRPLPTVICTLRTLLLNRVIKRGRVCWPLD